jgi:hypothetical protein
VFIPPQYLNTRNVLTLMSFCELSRLDLPIGATLLPLLFEDEA